MTRSYYSLLAPLALMGIAHSAVAGGLDATRACELFKDTLVRQQANPFYADYLYGFGGAATGVGLWIASSQAEKAIAVHRAEAIARYAVDFRQKITQTLAKTLTNELVIQMMNAAKSPGSTATAKEAKAFTAKLFESKTVKLALIRKLYKEHKIPGAIVDQALKALAETHGSDTRFVEAIRTGLGSQNWEIVGKWVLQALDERIPLLIRTNPAFAQAFLEITRSIATKRASGAFLAQAAKCGTHLGKAGLAFGALDVAAALLITTPAHASTLVEAELENPATLLTYDTEVACARLAGSQKLRDRFELVAQAANSNNAPQNSCDRPAEIPLMSIARQEFKLDLGRFANDSDAQAIKQAFDAAVAN